MPTSSVVQILSASIAPVIVISGVGLLLLSMTNRYGRAIDRARALMRELRQCESGGVRFRLVEQQLRVTHRRARLLRASVIFGMCSIAFVSLMILSLFAEQVFALHRDFLALPLFALSLIALVASMFYAIRDITVSLRALDLQIASDLADSARQR